MTTATNAGTPYQGAGRVSPCGLVSQINQVGAANHMKTASNTIPAGAEVDTQGWINFTEGRRGYRDTDFADMKGRRERFLDAESAIASMSGNQIAFRLYDRSEFGGGYGVGLLSEYAVIRREKKSRPYSMTDRRALASCTADAIDKLGEDYSGLDRIISMDEWPAIQSKQHLKALRIS